MPGRLVLFDCDGTLLDSHSAIATAMRLAFVQHRLPAPSSQVVRSLVGLSSEAMVHVLCSDVPGAPEAAILQSYNALFRRDTILASSVERMFPGVETALRTLNDPATTVGIVTGKARDTLERALDAFGIADLFQITVTADEAASKPAPDLVYIALAETGADPAKTVVIGDTIFDILMARAAGVRSIGVTWGSHSGASLERTGADRVVSDADDLLPAIDKIVPLAAPISTVN